MQFYQELINGQGINLPNDRAGVHAFSIENKREGALKCMINGQDAYDLKRSGLIISKVAVI